MGEGAALYSVLHAWGSRRAMNSKGVCLEGATQTLLFLPMSQTFVRTNIKQIASILQFTNSAKCWQNNEDQIKPDP